MSERADVNDVGVLRMDGDGGDVLRIFEAHVLPGLAAVSRLVNTIAKRHAVAHGRLARADPNDFRITRSERDVADRHRPLAFEDRFPRNAAVRRLPQTSGCTRDVDRV